MRSTDGSPLAGATLDVWQANGATEYSNFNPDVPDYNLRGRLKADDDGRFEFETVVPSPYEVSHESAAPLTTQIYFEDDPWIDADVVGAVKASLITKLERHEGHAPCSYDFVLPPSHGSGEPSRH